MHKLNDLKNERADKLKALDALIKKAEGEKNRDFTEEEQTRFDDLKAEIDELDGKIKKAEEVEAMRERIAENSAPQTRQPEKKDTPKQKARKQFSFTRFVKALHPAFPGVTLDGIEAEMSQEATREALQAGVTLEGHGIPSMVFGEQRDLEAGTATAGGDTVATNLGALIPALRPRSQVMNLGVTVMGGLMGDLDLPEHDGLTAATWKGEKATADESTPTVTKKSLSPERLTAYTRVTSQILRQSPHISEAWIQGELLDAVARKLDETVISGAGTGNIPAGLTTLAGVNQVDIDTNGGAPTRTHLLHLIRDIRKANADIGDMAFLTNPDVQTKLQDTTLDSGSGRFVWGDNPEQLLGYRALTSTHVPNNLTKGTSTDCSAILFGVWKEWLIGQWGGIDLIVNPYSEDKEGITRITVNSFWDMLAKYPKAFARILDARTI